MAAVVPRDPYRLPPDRRPTEPRREPVRVDEDAPDSEAETLARCPVCLGSGCVAPEVAVAVERMMQREEDKR